MKNKTTKLVYCGIFIAAGFILPFLTMQNRALGQMLCLMHIPVFICGFICGPYYGALCGFLIPLTRSILLGMPLLFPDAVNMAFELCAYGALSGLCYKVFPKKLGFTYLSLITAMLGGRLVYGVISFITYSLAGLSFSFEIYLGAAFVTPWMGIVLQLIIIVPVVLAINALRRSSNAKG